MTTCIRPGCNNDLNKGKRYCSASCAARDRTRLRMVAETLAPDTLSMPASMAKMITDNLGSNGHEVITEVNLALAQDSLAVIPFPSTGITYGEWTLSFDGTKDFRPGDRLDYATIEMMLKSGPVIFSMEMKRAAVFKVFSEGRFKVVSPDTELADVANAALKLIMPKMAADFTYSAFAYGASFQEKIWGNKGKYELGLSDTRDNSSFTVPFVPNSVKPSTVSYIRRTPDRKFDGFVQKNFDTNALSGIDEIVVERDAALVIPFNERFRNLWGESFLKALYPIWLWYEITLRTMARYLERMAMPVVVARAPSRSSVMIEGQSRPVRAMDLALALAGNVAKSNAVAIPSDKDENGENLWELDYLTATDKGQSFIQVLEFFQQEMIRAGLSADRSLSQSSGGVGSYNIGELHAQASSLTSEMILQQLVFYLNEYLMPEFSLYNRGKNGPPIWLRTQAIDLAERDLLMSLVGVAGNTPAGQEFFWQIDWATLGDISNIPLLDEADMKAKKDAVQKEQMDKMSQQQEIMAKNAAPIPKGGASAFPQADAKKPATPPPTQAEYDAAVESLFNNRIPWMLSEYEAKILYESGALDAETIQLFNPFHDKAGKFSYAKGAKVAGVSLLAAGTVSRMEGAVAKKFVQHKINKELRNSANDGISPDEVRGKVLSSHLIGTEIGGRKYGITYDHVDRAGTLYTNVGAKAQVAGTKLWSIGTISERINKAFNPSSPNKPSKPKPSKEDWPQAKQEEFHKMYRDLAKRYHPDINKSPDAVSRMQEINNFYSSSNFDAISSLHQQLEDLNPLELTDNDIASLVLLRGLMDEFLKSSDEYMVFDARGVDNLPPFIIENGEMILDRDSASLILDTLNQIFDTLEAASSKLEWDWENDPIQLFNPFHSRHDGRFTTHPGGIAAPAGGGDTAPVAAGGATSGSPAHDLATKHATIAQAKSKGSVIKTTGKILGLTGLGLVGFAVIAGVASASGGNSFDQYQEARQQKADELQKQLDDLTKDWPKTNSPDEAVGLLKSRLQGLGLQGIPADLKFQVGDVPAGAGGYYDPATDTLHIAPEIAGDLQKGDPVSMWAMMHEIAHSDQEVGDNNWGNFDGIPDGYNNPKYRDFIEGQNDLVTAMGISQMYGKPVGNNTAVEMSKQANELQADIDAIRTGTSLVGGVTGSVQAIGYSDESKVWAGIAAAGAAKEGITPKQYLIEQHANGFDGASQHKILTDLFPQEMQSVGGDFPSLSDVRDWMSNHGYTDPDKAYEEMLKEAASGS